MAAHRLKEAAGSAAPRLHALAQRTGQNLEHRISLAERAVVGENLCVWVYGKYLLRITLVTPSGHTDIERAALTPLAFLHHQGRRADAASRENQLVIGIGAGFTKKTAHAQLRAGGYPAHHLRAAADQHITEGDLSARRVRVGHREGASEQRVCLMIREDHYAVPRAHALRERRRLEGHPVEPFGEFFILNDGEDIIIYLLRVTVTIRHPHSPLSQFTFSLLKYRRPF